MRQQVQVTEESLFDFLTSTRMPLVSSLMPWFRRLAMAMTAGSLGFGAFALIAWDDGLWNAALPWAGALPALLASPGYFTAWLLARRGRMQAAALALFVAIYTVAILATWPRGVFCATWYLQPILALIACCSLGAVPGLLLTLGGVVSLLSLPIISVPTGDLHLVVWTHSTSLAAVTLASALAGVVVHKLLVRALTIAEQQRDHHHEAVRALRYRERLLRHAMRVETVGDLAGMVTHQLRNSFQVMLGHATLGAMGDDAERAQRLTLLAEELGNSRPLLDQLMSLAHPDEGAPEAKDLDAELRAFFERARRVMPSNIKVVHESSGRTLPVLVNPRGLEHALWNLVINARQAMPEGGTITLRASADGAIACIDVADSGCGIPDAIRERIFDPYFTTKPMGQGTGLGLAAVDRFVRSSQGRIDLHSQVGVGTRFRLTFPLQEVAA